MWSSNVTSFGKSFARASALAGCCFTVCCLTSCGAAEGEPPFSRVEGDQDGDGPTGRVVHGGGLTAQEEGGARAESVDDGPESKAKKAETGSLQAMPSAEDSVDESVPPPAGLIDQSDPFAPVRRYRLNESYRVRIDELKRQLDGMVDGPAKDHLLDQLAEVADQYRATREGLIDTQTIIGSDGASGMTKDERLRLLRLMANYDMSKPEDVAEWNRVKSEELGR